MHNQKADPNAKDREPTEEEIKAALARMDEARANLPEIVATQNAMLRLKLPNIRTGPTSNPVRKISSAKSRFFRTY